MAVKKIIDAIPHGFTCPLCVEVKPSVSQWAVTLDGKSAVCRPCIARRPELWLSPLGEKIRGINKNRFMGFKHSTLLTGGECIRGCGRTSRRLDGLCSPCFYRILRAEHGGLGQYRVDSYGRHFCVVEDTGYFSESNVSVTRAREAEYTWGPAVLPKAPSIESSREEFDIQAKFMWEGVNEHLDYAMNIASIKAGHRYSDNGELHDLILETTCKAVLMYDSSHSNAQFRTYLNRAVTNSTFHFLKQQAYQRKRVQYSDMIDEVVNDIEDESEKNRLGLLFGPVHTPEDIIQILGLTAFQRKLLRLYAVDGLTLEAIGFRYGVVKATVHAWILKIRRIAEERMKSLQDV